MGSIHKQGRWLKFVLLMCIAVSVTIPVPSVASAYSGSGSGTAEDPYLISSVEQLLEINNDLYAHYKLVNDIDLWDASHATEAGWQPLGYFHGTLDGNGYTVRNLRINRSDTNEIGLFGRIGDARISNLTVENVDILGGGNVGSVAGISFLGTITNVSASGKVRGKTSVGGLTGSNTGGSLNNVVFWGEVQGSVNASEGALSAHTGGIVGYNSNYDGSTGTVQNAYGFGTIQAKSNFGGIVGYNDGLVSNAYALNDSLLHHENMAKGEAFGRITSQAGGSGTFGAVFASPVTTPPVGYGFNGDPNLNGLTMSAADFGTVRAAVDTVVADVYLRQDLGVIIDAQTAWTISEPGYQGMDTSLAVTQNLTLSGGGVGQAVLTWNSWRPDIVDSYGVVTRPKNNANENVTLTATVTGSVYSGSSIVYTRPFELTVLKAPPAVKRVFMVPGDDQIFIDLEQDFVSIDPTKITVTAGGTPLAGLTQSYVGRRLTLELESAVAVDQSVAVTLQAGAVTDNNGESNATITRSVEQTDSVTFDDPDLEEAVRSKLGIPSPDPIERTDMEQLTNLYPSYSDITDLTGLEYATNLLYLSLSGNPGITDFTPLASLTNLIDLTFDESELTDISWISALTSLETVSLEDNLITNTAPLNALSNLRYVDLYGNQITAPAISGLIELTEIDLSGNAVTTTAGLAGLTALRILYLDDNQLTAPTLSGMSSLESLGLSDNEITNVSGLTGLGKLYDLDLSGNALTTPTFSGMGSLVELDLYDNDITSTAGLAGLTALRYLDLSGNALTAPVLSGLPNLYRLYLADNQITNISGVNNLPGLYRLDVSGNALTAPAFVGMDALEDLDLSDNAITDISNLGSLPNLWYLYLDNNLMVSADFTNKATSVRYLYLSGNRLTSVTGLSGHTLLKELDLSFNALTSVPDPTGMTGLKNLDASYNQISVLSALEGNVSLADLDLSNNQIVDIAPLGTTKVDYLYLANNDIVDLSPLLTLYDNGGLETSDYYGYNYAEVDVTGNPLNITEDESVNRTIVTTLQSHNVDVMYEITYDEEFVISPSKGVVGPDEYLEFIVAKTTEDHDVSKFEFVVSMNPDLWMPIGYAPADGLGESLTLHWEPEEGGIRVTGVFDEGEEPTGAVDLVKIYLWKSTVLEEEPSIDSIAMSEEGPPDMPFFPTFGIFGAFSVDGDGVERFANPANFTFVPLSSPDVNEDGYTDEIDVALISDVFGKREEDFSDEVDFENYDMNWNGVIDMDDITFVYMRAKAPDYDPNAPGPDMVPFELPEVEV